jgi:uncharacterized protein YkuJ
MKIVRSTLRAIIQRITELEVDLDGEDKRLYVFEKLDEKGVACDYWVQNWECENITDTLDHDDHKEIKKALYDYYKNESNSKE